MHTGPNSNIYLSMLVRQFYNYDASPTAQETAVYSAMSALNQATQWDYTSYFLTHNTSNHQLIVANGVTVPLCGALWRWSLMLL